MKKILVLLSVLILTLALCACGVGQTGSDPTVASHPDTSSKADTASSTDSKAITTATVNRLFDDFDLVDHIGACGIEMDANVRETIDGVEFTGVYDPRFRSTEDIRAFMENVVTDKLLNSRYQGTLDGDQPLYIDHDGKLLARPAGRGCGFNYLKDAVIVKQDETTFTATREFDNFGAPAILTINAVYENGLWKVDSFTVE